MKKLFYALALMITCAVLGMAATGCGGSPPPAKNTDLFFTVESYSDLIHTIYADRMTPAEKVMVASLQGIAAKTSARIYIVEDNDGALWLEELQRNKGIRTVAVADPWELVGLYGRLIAGSKYVLYNMQGEPGVGMYDQSINYATTVAAAESYLMISGGLEKRALEYGLTLGRDVRTGTDTLRIFGEYRDVLNPAFLVHQAPDKWQLRDYAIAGGAMCFYADYYDGATGVAETVLGWADDNAPVLGWTENELDYVAVNSLMSKVTLAADWSANLTLLSAVDAEPLAQKTTRPVTAQKNKHYVAVVMSDGDNVQWMSNAFATDPKFYGSRHRGAFPVTWTTAPSLYDLNPTALSYLYNRATADDYFIAGPSGAGYVNLTEYNDRAVSDYGAYTSAYMEAADLRYVNLLDNTADPAALDAIARQENVRGGVWSVGEYYRQGGGAVYWSHGKPFVTVREVLWRDAGAQNDYYGYVERVAQRINAYRTDCTRIEGYTVLLAHAWSVGTMDYLARFAELLDDDVELVTVDRLLEMVAQNVKAEDVSVLDDARPEDFDGELAAISSEQYRPEDLAGMTADPARAFVFDDPTGLGNWRFGTSGKEYDFAGLRNGFVELDGSNLGEGVDPLPNAWMVNRFDLGADTRYLEVFASAYSDTDVSMRIRFLQTQDDRLVSFVPPSDDYEKRLDEYGYYLLDASSPFRFVFDVGRYAGQTVYLSVEQADSGQGSGEIVRVDRIAFYDAYPSHEDLYQWDPSLIRTLWQKSGEVVVHKEGVCLEAEGASVSHTVMVDARHAKLTLSAFIFKRSPVPDPNAYLLVKANGAVIRPEGGYTDYVEIGGYKDDGILFTYDLSGLVGSSVTLEIVSVKVNSSVGAHACIDSIVLGGTV